MQIYAFSQVNSLTNVIFVKLNTIKYIDSKGHGYNP